MKPQKLKVYYLGGLMYVDKNEALKQGLYNFNKYFKGKYNAK